MDSDDLDVSALREIFGDDYKAAPKTANKKEKPKRPPQKKTNKSGARPAQKKRAPINLDSLMDGIEPIGNADIDEYNENIDENNIYEMTKLTKTNNYDFASSYKPDKIVSSSRNTERLNALEKNIEKYLETSLRSMYDDFVTEIEQILINCDVFDKVVFDFLEQIRSLTRDSIIFEFENSDIDFKNSIPSIFNSFSDQFLASFRLAGEFTSKSYLKRACIVRTCRSLVTSQLPSYERQLRDSLEQLNTELEDLYKIRDQNFASCKDIDRKASHYKRNNVILENKLEVLDDLTEDMNKKFEKFLEMKNRYFSKTENEYPDADLLSKRVQYMSRFFRSKFKDKEKKVNDTYQEKLKNISILNNELQITLSQSVYAIGNILNNSSNIRQIPVKHRKPYDISDIQSTTQTAQILANSRDGLRLHQTKRETQFEQMNSFFNGLQHKSNKTLDDDI